MDWLQEFLFDKGIDACLVGNFFSGIYRPIYNIICVIWKPKGRQSKDIYNASDAKFRK